MFDKGFFGGLFDLDNNGELDSFEKAMDFCLFCEMTEKEESDDVCEFDEDDLW